VTNVEPDELLDSNTVTGPPVFAITLPNWSCTWTWNGPTDAVVPTVWFPDTVCVNANLLGGAAVTVNDALADVTEVWDVSVAVRVYAPVALMARLLKLATPLAAVAVMVELPEENLPVDSAILMLSVDPVYPVVMALPYWSSTVTPTLNEAPAANDDGGAVVMASLFSGPGVMVSVCRAVANPDEEAVMMGDPAVESP
jgi:hypothetical protein